MTKTTKNSWQTILFYTAFVAYIVIICGGYYKDGRNITVNNLASDNWSILPMVQKLTDTSLFLQDQFAYSVDVVRLYIPAFTNGVLFFADLMNGDILQGYNLFNILTVAAHIVLWFTVLLMLTGSRWTSFLFTMMMRGILWPPGNEIWGAGNLEYFLPRTVFAALLPLFFIALVYSWQHRKQLVPFTFLILGLVGNFHPISAMGNGVAAIAALLFACLLNGDGWLKSLRQSLLSGLLFSAGIFPFVWLYLNKDIAQASITYDKALFTSLISERIGGSFRSPWVMYMTYLRPQWLLLITGSYALTAFYRKKITIPYSLLKYLWLLGAMVFIMPLFFHLAQLSAHALGFKYMNFSYELSRTGKYVIVPCFLLYSIGFQALLSSFKKYETLVPALGTLFFILVSWLAMGPLAKTPGFKSDFLRAQLPQSLTGWQYLPYMYTDLDSALYWIQRNTPKDARFAGAPQIRGGALRSVPFDYKGASVLLEYNKPKYIEWAQKNIEFEDLKTDQAIIDFYKSLKIDYLLTDKVSSNTDSLLKTFGKYRFYKLRY